MGTLVRELYRDARPVSTRAVRALGATDRCALAVRAYRVLLDRRHGKAPLVGDRLWRVQSRLEALLPLMNDAERAHYDDQVWVLENRLERR